MLSKLFNNMLLYHFFCSSKLGAKIKINKTHLVWKAQFKSSAYKNKNFTYLEAEIQLQSWLNTQLYYNFTIVI